MHPETPRAARIRLRPPAWPGHLAGQHVDVRLTAEDGYTAQRSYSIASPPVEPLLDLVVERLDDGEVSPYLTGELRAGDMIELRGPIGGYFVWPDPPDGPVQLIAGGSGVVPFLAMLGQHRAVDSAVPVRLLYSVRSAAEVIGRAVLDGVRPPAQVDLTFTREAPASWAGATGRVDVALLARRVIEPAQRPHILVCGPTAFVETVANGLTDLGHDPARIRTERFGGMGVP